MRTLNGWIMATALAAAAGFGSKEARAQATTDSNFVLADFETNLQSTRWNGYWFHYDDAGTPAASDTTLRGNSKITSLDSMGYPFYDDSGYYDKKTYPLGRTGEANTHSSRMAFSFGDRMLSCGTGCSYSPYVGWALIFTTLNGSSPNDTIDLTGAKAISFWAKSDTDTVTVDFSLIIRDSSNAPDYSQVIHIGPQWAKYTVSLDPAKTGLTQPTWAAKKAFNLKHAAGIGFGFNRGENSKVPANGMSIDDILIEGWTWKDPNEIDAIRPWARASASKAGWRLQIQGSQIRLMRMDGDRLMPFNMNGRALPVR